MFSKKKEKVFTLNEFFRYFSTIMYYDPLTRGFKDGSDIGLACRYTRRLDEKDLEEYKKSGVEFLEGVKNNGIVEGKPFNICGVVNLMESFQCPFVGKFNDYCYYNRHNQEKNKGIFEKWIDNMRL